MDSNETINEVSNLKITQKKKDKKEETREEWLERVGKKLNGKIKSYNEIEEKSVEWIWFPYIPRGKIVIVVGDPGSGKTFFSTYIASVISNGGKFYNSEEIVDKGIVLLQNGEDGKSDTLKARLSMLNANYENIIFIDEADMQITLKNTEYIEYILEVQKPTILIFDPITLYIGEKVDINSASEVRKALNPLVSLLERYNCTLLLISHMNKGVNKSIYKGLGSIDFVAIARSYITITINPNNDKERLLIHTKPSIGIKGETLAFTITDNGIEWLGTRDINIDEETLKAETISKKEEAKRFILDYLGNGSKLGTDLFQAGIEAGYAQKTFENARNELKKDKKISSYKSEDKWYWQLYYVEEELPF